MKTMRTITLCLIILAAAWSPIGAASIQVPAEAEARLRAIYEKGEFNPRTFRGVWLPDGSGYTLLEPAAGAPAGSSARDIVAYTAADGKRTILASSTQLAPQGAAEPLAVEAYLISPDGKRIIIDRRGFRIVGVVENRVESGMFGQMGSTEEIFIPFPTAWRLWDPWIYAVACCRSPDLSSEAQAELRFFLRQREQLREFAGEERRALGVVERQRVQRVQHPVTAGVAAVERLHADDRDDDLLGHAILLRRPADRFVVLAPEAQPLADADIPLFHQADAH